MNYISKLICGVVLVLLCSSIFSCKKDEEATDWITPTAFTAGYEADTMELILYSVWDWEIVPRNEWVVPEVASGAPLVPEDTIRIFIAANPTRFERETKVDVIFDVEGTSPRILTIYQEAIPNGISTDLTNLRVPSPSSTKTINLTANVEWQIAHIPSWIKVIDLREVGFDPSTEDVKFEMDIEISQNIDPHVRYDAIRLEGTSDTSVELEIEVFQDGNSNLKTDSLNLLKLYEQTRGAEWKSPWDTSLPLSQWKGVSLDSVEYSGGKELRVVGVNMLNNNLVGVFPNELLNIAHLKLLWLEKNQISGVVSDALFKLKFLENLRLGENSELEGTLSPEITYMSGLISLSIYDTKFSGTLPEELGDLAALNFIDINSCNFSGTLPVKLGQNRNLGMFIIMNNYFSGAIPSSYTNNINWYDWQPELYIYPQNGTGFTL